MSSRRKKIVEQLTKSTAQLKTARVLVSGSSKTPASRIIVPKTRKKGCNCRSKK